MSSDGATAPRSLPLLAARGRRAVLVRRVRLAAAATGSSVDLRVALDARIGRRFRIEITAGSQSSLVVGPGCRFGDDVLVRLDGGRIRIGPWCNIRRGVILNVSGELALEGHNVLSFGTIVNCAGRTTIAELACVGDHTTIVDSTHYFTSPDVPFHHNVKAGEVAIGHNSWIGSKATITRGSRIGAHCIVGANSLVRGEIPDGHVAVGVPAEPRPATLPWQDG